MINFLQEYNMNRCTISEFNSIRVSKLFFICRQGSLVTNYTYIRALRADSEHVTWA